MSKIFISYSKKNSDFAYKLADDLIKEGFKGLKQTVFDFLEYPQANTVIEGELKCNSEDPYLRETGFWYFNDDSTEVEVTIGTEFYILKIIELSTDKFHYIYTHHDDTTVLRLSSATNF